MAMTPLFVNTLRNYLPPEATMSPEQFRASVQQDQYSPQAQAIAAALRGQMPSMTDAAFPADAQPASPDDATAPVAAPSYDEQASALKRRMALAEQLRGVKAPTETQMVSGRAVPNSPWVGLGAIGQQLLGGYEAKKADEQQAALEARKAAALASILGDKSLSPSDAYAKLATSGDVDSALRQQAVTGGFNARIETQKEAAAQARADAAAAAAEARQNALFKHSDDATRNLFAQQIKLQGMKEAADTAKANAPAKPPKDYRWNETGDALEVIPGSAAETKLKAQKTKDDAVYRNTTNMIDETIKTTQKLLDTGAYKDAAGFINGNLVNVKGTPQYDAAHSLATLKGQQVLSTINALKSGSSSGSTGIGRVLQSEIPLFANSLGNLDVGQSEEQLKANLENHLQNLNALKQSITNGYGEEYSALKKNTGNSANTAPGPQETKILGGKTYVKIDGKWHTQ